jgi:hypothetical protein
MPSRHQQHKQAKQKDAKILNRPDKVPFEQLEDLGVALKRVHVNPELVHIGIIYKPDDQPVRMCHFAEDRSLLDQEAPGDYRWLQVVLDPNLRRFLVGTCQAIVARNDPIRYGFPYEPPYFSSATFEYVARPLGYGLTCATFVLAVFNMAKVDLVDVATWPNATLDDQIWQQRIVRAQKFKMVSDAMAEHIGAKRFRPEEVAAGTISNPRPLTYEAVRPIAERIVADVRRNN